MKLGFICLECVEVSLLSDRMWEMCDQVSDEYAKEMKLFITTNLTELEYKGNSVHKLAEKFKHLWFSSIL